MPKRTNTYNLEYFKQGSYYSAKSDRRRFLTMDYNLKSYIGVVGIGIINGWTIEEISGLNVQIIPGAGVASGFYMESPYVVKQRSEMVDGDREISTMPSPDGEPEEDLTSSQRAIYVSVIQLYDSSFNPVGSIENAYVKVVVPEALTLSNNTDSYIYAKRPSGATPYPKLDDYPPSAGDPPNRANYSTYDTYRVALNEYQDKLDAIHNYQWYTNSDNHFTEVNFTVKTTLVKSSSQVLLGEVSTRNDTVETIDVSGVDSIANFESKIKEFAGNVINNHRHGGSGAFDPPAIQLATDIRNTTLSSYDSSAGKSIFNILSNKFTEIELGHKHTFSVRMTKLAFLQPQQLLSILQVF